MNSLFAGQLKYSLGWLVALTALFGQQPQLCGQDFDGEATSNDAPVKQDRPERTLDDFRKGKMVESGIGAVSSGSEMGSEAGAGGMGMFGGIGGINPGAAPPTEKQLLAQLIQRLRERLNSKKHDRRLVENQLRVALQQYFDTDMEERVKEFDRVKARLAQMESKLQKRLNSDQEIIELQLKQMLHQADGLDFSIPSGDNGGFGMPGMGGMEGGFGSAGMPSSGGGTFGSDSGSYGGSDGAALTGSAGLDAAAGGYSGPGFEDQSQSMGYDSGFGLTRIQRLDGEALDDQDPLESYMRTTYAKADGEPNQSNADKLKNILTAFHHFYSQFDHLPSSANRHTKSQPPHSWRVAILPLIGYGSLYREYKFEQAWDSPDNLRVASKMPELYRSANSKSKDSTLFQMLVGGGAFDSSNSPPDFARITDGTSNTIALIESDKEVVWTKPEDVEYSSGGLIPLSVSRLAGFADGQVRRLPKNLTPTQLHALITRAGGEVVELTKP
jgi:Protein of unknown function (DUF1559)